MREWLEKFKPNPWLSRKLLLAAVLLGVGAGAFCWGRHLASAKATSVNANPEPGNGGACENGTRVVAYYHNQPIYREELGEFLIARFGAERIQFLVNRKIVEAECRKYNITVTDADVEWRFQHELHAFGNKGVPMLEKDFVNQILGRFHKTLYEWKEDVIRPKLMMERLVRATIRITSEDVREGFEARYGPKVECRMIVLGKDHHKVDEFWARVHTSRAEFMKEAKNQFLPNLKESEGLVPAIHKHFGDKDIEAAAFRLKVGEISTPIKLADGTSVILLCEQHLPENKTMRFENEYQKIAKEMEDLRVAQRIPDVFKELYEGAHPQILLKNETAMVGGGRVEAPPGQSVQLPPNNPPPPLKVGVPPPPKN